MQSFKSVKLNLESICSDLDEIIVALQDNQSEEALDSSKSLESAIEEIREGMSKLPSE